MPKKVILIITLLSLVFLFFIYRTFDLAYNKKEYYQTEAQNINEVYVTGSSAPRGKILDINGEYTIKKKYF